MIIDETVLQYFGGEIIVNRDFSSWNGINVLFDGGLYRFFDESFDVELECTATEAYAYVCAFDYRAAKQALFSAGKNLWKTDLFNPFWAGLAFVMFMEVK